MSDASDDATAVAPAPMRRKRTRWTPQAALALGAGFLVALSLPPWGFWPLAFVGVALFEVSLGEHPTRGQRATRGWLFAAAWLFPGMGWMWFLTAPGYLVAASLFAGLHALAAVCAPTGPWRTIGRPAAHALVESIRLIVPFGGVPLASLAIGQTAGPLLGVARVGGVILLNWLVLQVGFALAGPSPYVPAIARRARRAQWHGAVGFLAAVAVVVLALVAPSGSATGRSLRVAVVQGGGPQGTHAIHTDSRVVVERHLAVTRTIEPGSVDVVVWPENVIDVVTFVGSRELEEVASEAQRIGATFVVGITEDVPVSEEHPVGAFLNAQVVVTPEGEVVSRYEKVRRVPFGEYMPLRGLLDLLGAPVDQVPRDAIAGTGPAVLDLPTGDRLAVVISWEVFFGDRARDGVSHGGEAIVNPTNGSSYTGTILQTQQVASSRLRAVENGRWVVQASPTGFSAFVTDDGHVLERTAVSEARVITHEVPLRTGSTWYRVLGDWPFRAMLAGAFGLSWWAERRRVRSLTPPTAP
jgi:apolipoprotein N-acyltransferase